MAGSQSAAVARACAAPRSFVGIFAANCVEWVLFEQAANAQAMVTVPLYDTLGAEAVDHIVGESRVAAVLCHTNNVATLLATAAPRPHLHDRAPARHQQAQ